MKKIFLTVLIIVLVIAPEVVAGENIYKKLMKSKQAMVEKQIKARGITDANVLKAMAAVNRHDFVPAKYRAYAYKDRPLSIGYGQTISQPYVVAFMTEILSFTGNEKVLEIGTGSGYQAAILGEVAGQVFSMEIIPELYKYASDNLSRKSYSNIQLKSGDGYYGWEEHAPFDRIIVTCAAGHIPPSLLKQLKNGGRMIIPVGKPWAVQSLVLVEKDMNGRVTTRNMMTVRFVPLTRPD